MAVLKLVEDNADVAELDSLAEASLAAYDGVTSALKDPKDPELLKILGEVVENVLASLNGNQFDVETLRSEIVGRFIEETCQKAMGELEIGEIQARYEGWKYGNLAHTYRSFRDFENAVKLLEKLMAFQEANGIPTFKTKKNLIIARFRLCREEGSDDQKIESARRVLELPTCLDFLREKAHATIVGAYESKGDYRSALKAASALSKFQRRRGISTKVIEERVKRLRRMAYRGSISDSAVDK